MEIITPFLSLNSDVWHFERYCANRGIFKGAKLQQLRSTFRVGVPWTPGLPALATWPISVGGFLRFRILLIPNRTWTIYLDIGAITFLPSYSDEAVGFFFSFWGRGFLFVFVFTTSAVKITGNKDFKGRYNKSPLNFWCFSGVPTISELTHLYDR